MRLPALGTDSSRARSIACASRGLVLGSVLPPVRTAATISL